MKPILLLLFAFILTACQPEPIPEVPKCISYHFADGLHPGGSLHESCYEGGSGEIITWLSTTLEEKMLDRTFEISIAELEKTGKQQGAADQLVYDFIKGVKYKRINDILARLVPHTKRKDIQYKIHLVEHRKVPESVNAWANADGSIQITVTFLEFTGSDDELAFVIAHEISHCENWCADQRLAIDHLLKEKTGSFFSPDFFSNNLGLLPGLNQYNEIKADRAALYLMNQAGYDPEKSLDVFEHLEALSKEDRGIIFLHNFLSSHPYSTTRYDCLNRYLRESKQQLKPCP